MRYRYRLILVALLLIHSGCVRERDSADMLVVTFRWWTMLWGIVVPLCFAGMVFAKHPSTWMNGKWRPWWKFQGWEVKEFSYAIAALVLIPIFCATIFDRVEVGRDYFRESTLSPLRGSRRVEFREVSRIELPPPVVKERVFKLKTPALKKNDKAPADLAVVFNDGGKEEFNSQLVRAAKDAIIKRAQEAHVPVVIASGIEFRSPAPLHRPDNAPGFDRMEEMRERSRTKTN